MNKPANLIGYERNSNWKQVHHFLTYPVREHFVKTYKVNVSKGEVKQTLVGKSTGIVFLQRYLAVYVGSPTIINDFRLSNCNYKMFFYGNNVHRLHTYLSLRIFIMLLIIIAKYWKQMFTRRGMVNKLFNNYMIEHNHLKSYF